MINIAVKCSTSYGTVDEFKKVLEMVKADNIVSVRIFYDKMLPDYDCSLEEYPVKMDTNVGVTIYLYSLSAGYAGTGPNDLVKVLQLAGFAFDKSDILQKRNVVDITYTK